MLADEQRLAGVPVFDWISSLYMATDQLRIEEYDRVVIPSFTIEKATLFGQLAQNFDIESSKQPVQPKSAHTIGLYFAGKWYSLIARPHTYINKGAAAILDAGILQETVLSPLFRIEDPKTDLRLKCAGGARAMDEIEVLINAHPGAIVFTISPLTVKQLIAVADAGEILPPKSTWIVPKIPYALLLHQH